MKQLFVTGTDTGVGKTIVSTWLCLHWQADYWKPIQSGLNPQDGLPDSEQVKALCNIRTHTETHRLTQPLSPHQAAAQDGVQIKLSDFCIPKAERLIVEGAGGCMVPINRREQMTDLIKHFDLCTVLVARSGLGTINHSCLSLQALKLANVPVLGVIMVGLPNPANKEAIEHFGQVPVLAELPTFDKLNAEHLKNYPMPERLLNALNSL